MCMNDTNDVESHSRILESQKKNTKVNLNLKAGEEPSQSREFKSFHSLLMVVFWQEKYNWGLFKDTRNHLTRNNDKDV